MGNVIRMNCCASVYCMKLISPISLVWHNSTILLQCIRHRPSLLTNALLQMSCNLRSGRDRGSGDDDLPPPPPPTPSDLLAMLVEGQRALGDAMRTLAQHQA